MKNSPDQDWFDRLSRRLGDYHEEPDDIVVKRIFAATRYRAEPKWLTWAHRTEEVTCVLLLIWSLLVFTDEVGRVYKQREVQREAVAKEKSSPVENAEATSRKEVKMKASSPALNYPGAVREFVRATALTGPYPMMVRRHTTGSLFSFPEIEISISPIIRHTASADSADGIGPYEIAPDEGKNEAPIIPTSKRHSLVFYGSVSPSLGFQKISPFRNDGLSIESLYRKPIFSEDRLGLSVKGGLQWQVGRRLQVYSGFLWYSQSQILAYHYLSGENGNLVQEEEFAYTIVPGKRMKRIDYSMLNVGAEAGCIYHLKGDRLVHMIGAGVSWQHGVRASRNAETYDNAKSQYLFYQVFYRNEYVVNNRLKVFIQPFYKHILVSREVMDEPFDVRPYRAGLSFGIVYQMR
jgi:hypothetical protein